MNADARAHARRRDGVLPRRSPATTRTAATIVSLDPTKPTALDLELKILENGHYVFKQVREFAGH